LFCALTACATVPTRFSARSAASPEASAAPPVVVARSLTEEPPLPGQAGVDGWRGLAPATGAAPDPHAHHHHHPGMVMPAPADAGSTTTEASHAP
jgi:hypothetical protein